jgi:hypothetical protein
MKDALLQRQNILWVQPPSQTNVGTRRFTGAQPFWPGKIRGGKMGRAQFGEYVECDLYVYTSEAMKHIPNTYCNIYFFDLAYIMWH